MRADEFAAYRRQLPHDYAAEIARVSARQPEEVLARCEREIRGLLPDGMLTRGHRFLVAEDDVTGGPVGRAWFAGREVQGRDVLWIYDIEVAQDLRGRGLGREIMQLLESEARAAGHDRIELNVFGGNEAALRLYGSLGFAETSRQMAKDLIAEDPEADSPG